MDEYFKIGKIVKPQGLKGEVRVYPYSDYPDRLLELDGVYLDMLLRNYLPIEYARVQKNVVVIKFEGYDTIDEAYELINSYLYIEREELEDNDVYYIADIIGSAIIDESKGELGIIKDVIRNKSQDLYEVELKDGNIIYIPVVDEFVKEIDVENKRISVKLIEGMV